MGLPTLYLLMTDKVIGTLATMVFVLLDEKIKEDYWIKLSDFEITHENILLALILTLFILLV